MVESGAVPGVRIVTAFAIRRKSTRCVVRIRGSIVIRQVTSRAIAGHSTMIESGAVPGVRIVTAFAIRRKSTRCVVRIRGRIVIRQMTGRAIAGHSTMIEVPALPGDALPGDSVVARLTGGGEAHGRMVRVGRCLVLAQVTGAAHARQPAELSVLVAGVAIHRLVRTEQRKLRVDKPLAFPNRGTVTLLAVSRPAQSEVVGVLRALEVLLMARFALGVGPAEVADLSAQMTAKAGHGGMGADQRKTSSVVHRNLTVGQPVVF